MVWRRDLVDISGRSNNGDIEIAQETELKSFVNSSLFLTLWQNENKNVNYQLIRWLITVKYYFIEEDADEEVGWSTLVNWSTTSI